MRIKSKYELLNNKEWLEQKYLVEKLGTIQICRLAGAKTANSARQALIRHGIPVRSISDGLGVNREDSFVMNEEVITGCLLGDGFLRIWNSDSEVSYPYFAKRNINYDHVVFVAGLVFANGGKEQIAERKEKAAWDGSPYTVFELRSFVHRELKPWYDKWYPSLSERVKVVPKDIRITPSVLLHWFLDDGTSYLRKRPTRQVVIRLCSESFSRKDQEMLCEKIELLGIKCRLHRESGKACVGTGWRIEVKQSSADTFYNVIGPCPIQSMAYKWK